MTFLIILFTQTNGKFEMSSTKSYYFGTFKDKTGAGGRCTMNVHIEGGPKNVLRRDDTILSKDTEYSFLSHNVQVARERKSCYSFNMSTPIWRFI
jgi:hypothetical protein